MSGAAAPLQLSIDLALEIKNITQKQHLNDVHFAVQLVRHALRHGAPEVRITSTRTTFTVEHEGDPLHPDERDLIFLLLGDADTRERQAAMTRLEQDHGVTLLSLLVNEARVEVSSQVSFSSREGRLVRTAGGRARGTRIVVHRPRRSLREERRELAFYCRCADVLVVVNGRALKRTPIGQELEAPLLAMAFNLDEGHGTVGLTPAGMMSRTRYYKHGIYFGVRQHLPSDNLPLEATYNSTARAFEENFRRSVRAAGAALRTARDRLLAHLPERYPRLSAKDQERVRTLLLGMAERRWSDDLRRLPLFDTGARRASLSLADLVRLGEDQGFVAWVPRSEAPRVGPRSRLPILDEALLAPLGRLLNAPLRRALPAVLPPQPPPPTPLGSALPLSACPAPVQALLRALDDERADVRFLVTRAAHRSVEEQPTCRVIALPVTDPVLTRAAAVFAEHPDRLDVLRAALAC